MLEFYQSVLKSIIFVAKSKDPEEIKQIQKLQTFRHFYGSTLGDSTSKVIVCQEDVSENASAAVRKIKKKHVSMFKSLFPNVFSLIQDKISTCVPQLKFYVPKALVLFS